MPTKGNKMWGKSKWRVPKYVRKTSNPKKCLVCGIEFFGHWNKIYCGNAARGKRLFGCAYKRDRASATKEAKDRAYEKFKKSGKLNELWKRAKKKYYEKNKEMINFKRRLSPLNKTV